MSFHGKRAGSAASDVAHAWAHQTKDSMNKNNVFFNGNTIYSYGHHFPVAMLLDDNHVLFTLRTYSNTTARHMSHIRSAISHKTFIYCWNIPDSSSNKLEKWHHDKNIESWIKEVKNKLDEVVKAKQQRTKDRLMGELHPIQEQARKYIAYFKLKPTREQNDQLFTTNIEGYLEGVKRAEAAAKRKTAALVKKGKELHPVWLNHWRNFTEYEFWETADAGVRKAIESVEFEGRDHNWVRLRAWNPEGESGHFIKTSKNITIPVDIAHRYYRKYLAVVKAGGCSETCNYKMLEFNVQEMNADHILVGCHDIARSEIDYIAEKLGWVK